MDSNTLAKLVPANESSAAISDALAAIDAEIDAANTRLGDAKARLDAGALKLVSKERRIIRDEIDDLELDLVQLSLLKTSTEAALADAREAEAYEAAKQSHATLSAFLADHEAGFLKNYRTHQAAILKILMIRRKLADDIDQHNDESKKFPALQIDRADQLRAAIFMTRFYKTDAELQADADAEQARRDAERWARIEAAERRNAELIQQQIARASTVPIGPVVSVIAPRGV